MNSSDPQNDALLPLIELKSLTKRFGRVQALSDVSLEVPRGAVGLLGPNGAGKTTLLKILLGLSSPTDGEARIAGFNPRRSADRIALRRKIGFMPESDCLIPRMNAVDIVSNLGRLSGLPFRDAMTRAHESLDYVGLDEERYRDLEGFSTGMKQRLKLAQALVHDPEILLLDEPTNGLDPRGRNEMLELIHDLGSVQRKSVLLCSHLLPDVEKTCEHVVVLRQGRMHLQGKIAELTASQQETVIVRVEGDRERFVAALQNSPHEVAPHNADALRVDLSRESHAEIDELFQLATECACAISSVEPVRSSLEEVFMSSIESPSAT